MHETRHRINSAEVADQMLKLNRPVSGPELVTILCKNYPHLLIEKHDVYIRLKGFYRSKQADCVMDDSVRPRTFHLRSISSIYFKFRNGRKTDIGKTAIVRAYDGLDKPWKKQTKSQKERALRDVRALYDEIYRGLLVKRFNASCTLNRQAHD